MKDLVVKSPVFENNGYIPPKFSCDGKGVNPPLVIEGIPEKTHSLALVMEDPDAPAGLFVHWVAWNIPPTGVIRENPLTIAEGLNTAKKRGYRPPCPPSGTHRYVFKIYALDTMLNLNEFDEKDDLEKAMQGHVLSQGELIGLYKRTR